MLLTGLLRRQPILLGGERDALRVNLRLPGVFLALLGGLERPTGERRADRAYR
jgi:hypothetical protein